MKETFGGHTQLRCSLRSLLLAPRFVFFFFGCGLAIFRSAKASKLQQLKAHFLEANEREEEIELKFDLEGRQL